MVIFGLTVMSIALRVVAAPAVDCVAEGQDSPGMSMPGAGCGHCGCAGALKMKAMNMGDDGG